MKHVQHCPVCQGQAYTPYITTKDYTVSQTKFDIAKCNQCGLLITNPRPENLEPYYASDEYISHADEAKGFVATIYTMARSVMQRSKLRMLSRLGTPKTILDYGCGTGDFLLYCKQKGWDVSGVEPNNKAHKIAQRKLHPSDVWQTLPTNSTTYDIITMWHVLEHIPNPVEILRAVSDKLTQNGKLVIAVPNVNSWESNNYKEYWAAYDTPRHLWHFSRETITRLLSNAGYRLISTKPLILDSFYISLLSEQYATPQQPKLTGMINALLNGLKSNVKAWNTKEYSSLIYIFEKQ